MYIKRKKIKMLVLGMIKWTNYMDSPPWSCFIMDGNSRMIEFEIFRIGVNNDRWSHCSNTHNGHDSWMRAPNHKKCMTSTHYLQREPFFQNKLFTQGNMNESWTIGVGFVAPHFSCNRCMPTYTHVCINTPYDTHAYINTPTNICTHKHIIHTYIHIEKANLI